MGILAKWIGALLLATVSEQVAASSGGQGGACRQDDRGVIEAALTGEVGRLSKDKYLVMYDDTVVPRVSEMDDFLKHFKGEAAESMVKRNASTGKLPILPRAERIRFVQADERSRLFAGVSRVPSRAWQSFYSVFPGSIGLVNVSLPGYENSQCVSLLYVERQGGELAAEGAVIWLKWRNGTWHVSKRKTVWRS